MDRATSATSSGVVWLALAVHFGAGVVSIVAGGSLRGDGLVLPGADDVHPEPLRLMPLLLVLAFSPLLFLTYWMWRVRVRGRISGLFLGHTRPH